jgi:predicted metalloprotease with PDZ domain
MTSGEHRRRSVRIWRPVLSIVCTVGATLVADATTRAAGKPNLHYRVSVRPAASPEAIRIEGRVDELPAGSQSFDVVRNYGAAVDLQLVDGLEFHAGSRSLTEQTGTTRGWRIDHPGGPLSFRYRIRTDPAAHGLSFDQPGAGEMPQLNDRLAFLLGAVCFVRPLGIDAAQPAEVAWNLPPGWEAVTPWGIGREPTQAPNLEALTHNYLVATRSGTFAERHQGNFTYAVVWCGSGDVNEATAFLDNIGRVFQSANDLFGGRPSRPRYTLIVRDQAPQGMFEASPKSDTIQFNVPRGMSLHDVVGYARPGGASIFLTTLAHEYFHTWGIKEASAGDDESTDEQKPEQGGQMRWFGEGFTEYFARLIMLRAGLLDMNAFLDEMQEMSTTARQVNTSGRLNLVTASEEFFARDAGRSYCYHEGCVLAFVLDLELRQQAEGGRTLTEFMRRYIPEQRDEASGVETFIAAWQRFAPPSLRDIRPCLEATTPIDLEPILAGIGAVSSERKRLTFDSRAEECDGAICFDHVGPFAASRGLHDGDRVVAVDGKPVDKVADFYRGLGADPTPITVERDGRTIEMKLALQEERVISWTAPKDSVLAELARRE